MEVKSMTGFGRSTIEDENRKISVDIKAVNHRYLDLSVKLPRQLNYAEDIVRAAIQEVGIERGHIEVYVQYDDLRKEKKSIKVDDQLVFEYFAATQEIASLIGIKNDITPSNILTLRDVIIQDEILDNEDEQKGILKEAVVLAAKELIKARVLEGEKLKKDLLIKLVNIMDLVSSVESLSDISIKMQIDNLRSKIQNILGDVPLNEDRLLNEIVIYTDKVGIDEEVTRLKSHIGSIQNMLNAGGIVGKKIDFLVQEMNREVNTIGSKCSNLEIAKSVIEMKTLIEKIREQIQNIE